MRVAGARREAGGAPPEGARTGGSACGCGGFESRAAPRRERGTEGCQPRRDVRHKGVSAARAAVRGFVFCKLF